MREKLINIQVVKHKETGMYLAFSDDMKGLYVHAHTTDELDKRIPIAIKDIYEAAGRPVASVERLDHDGLEAYGFEPTTRRFQMREAA